MSQSLAPVIMSQTPATTPSSSNIEGIFDAALKSYKKKTKKDLKKFDLFRQLEKCDSPAAILAVFQADQFDPSRTGADDRLKKWFVPTVNVLYAFSATLGEGIGLVDINPPFSDLTLMSILQIFSPAKVVFAGVGVLLLVSGLVHPLVRALVTLSVLRQLRMLLHAKTSSSTSSDALKVSSDGSRFIPGFR